MLVGLFKMQKGVLFLAPSILGLEPFVVRAALGTHGFEIGSGTLSGIVGILSSLAG